MTEDRVSEVTRMYLGCSYYQRGREMFLVTGGLYYLSLTSTELLEETGLASPTAPSPG